MALKKTFSRTGATKANNRTLRRLALVADPRVCLFTRTAAMTDGGAAKRGEIWRIDTRVGRINKIVGGGGGVSWTSSTAYVQN